MTIQLSNIEIISLTPQNIHNHTLCGYKNIRKEPHIKNREWLLAQFENGLRYKVLYDEKDGDVAMIEYMPGEIAWRGVDAAGYMFIQCIGFFKAKYKGKGYGKMLLEDCIEDAKSSGFNGVAVVTSKKTWMADKQLFLKYDFEPVDKAPPKFELLMKKFKDAPSPKFRGNWKKKAEEYGEGLTIIYSYQCPYLAKSLPEIIETARTRYNIEPKLTELKTVEDAQNTPCAYSVFNIIYNGKLYACHPISKKRFMNIMEREIGFSTP